MLLAGLRQRYELAAADPDLAGQWRRFTSIGEIPGRVGTSLYGVMCGGDTTGFEYMCAVEVESFAGVADRLGRMRVPEQRYAVFKHDAGTSTLRSTWQQIFEWLAHGSYESAHKPDFELYGPHSDPLEGGGEIEIWVGVVNRDRHET